MDVAFVRRFLLLCTVVNYGVLLAWFLVFVFAHDWMLSIHGRWFHLSAELFDALHYDAMRRRRSRHQLPRLLRRALRARHAYRRHGDLEHAVASFVELNPKNASAP